MSARVMLFTRDEVAGLVQAASTKAIAVEVARRGDFLSYPVRLCHVAACLASLARAGEVHVARRINRRGRLPTCMWLPGRAP
jgi:hypothetical protein